MNIIISLKFEFNLKILKIIIKYKIEFYVE